MMKIDREYSFGVLEHVLFRGTEETYGNQQPPTSRTGPARHFDVVLGYHGRRGTLPIGLIGEFYLSGDRYALFHFILKKLCSRGVVLLQLVQPSPKSFKSGERDGQFAFQASVVGQFQYGLAFDSRL